MIEPDPQLSIPDRRQERLAIVGFLAAAAAGFCLHGFYGWFTGREAGLGQMFLALGVALFTPMGLGGAKSRYVSGSLRAKATLATAVSLPVSAVSLAASIAVFLREESFLLGAGAGLFILLPVICAWSMLAPGAVLTVDAKGFHDRRALRRALTWDEVRAFEVVRWHDKTLYRLVPDSTDDLTLIARWSAGTGFNGIAVGCNGLDCSDGDIVNAIRVNRPQLFGGNHTGEA
jgi:hypothetical protein